MANMSLPELTVFDGWVSDPILLEQLHETVRRDFEEKRGLPQSRRYNWWNGETLTLPVHEYISYTSRQLYRLFDLNCIGYEWRGNYNNSLPWHHDKDELLFEEAGVLLTPVVGTVLYLSGTDVINGLGGAFAINSDDSGKTADQVYPVDNRLVVFPGNRLHCIREFEGQRISLVVNFWDHVPKAFL